MKARQAAELEFIFQCQFLRRSFREMLGGEYDDGRARGRPAAADGEQHFLRRR